MSSKILRAASFAAQKHGHQVRKNKFALPYITHPLRVAETLSVEGKVLDEVTLTAALLHDVVEDANVSIDEIASTFGYDVADVVKQVTDDKTLPKDERKRLQVKNASHKSERAKLVKLGDKLDNCRDLQQNPPIGWTRERIQGYFVWSRAVIAGLRGTNAVLENELDKVFASTVTVDDGTTFKCIPDGDANELLEKYYESMKKTKD